MLQAASAAPRRKLSIRRATIETRAPVVGPTSNLKTRSRSFSDLADIFGAEAREHWLQPLQVLTTSPLPPIRQQSFTVYLAITPAHFPG